MFIDTHAHLYLEQFDKDLSDVIRRARESNVQKVFLPNIDSSTTSRMNGISLEYPELLFPLMGLHPCSVKESYKEEIKHVQEQLAKGNYFGIGETGIDLYWDETYKVQQIKSFEIQIELAKEYDLPIIIHSRDALHLTIELIEKHQDGNLTGVFHCFNGDLMQCQRIQDVNFYMGLGGVITYKKANMAEVVSKMKLKNIILETDAPYLSPVPYRGKRNESSYIPEIAKMVAEFRNDTIESIQNTTTVNAKLLFKKAFEN